MSQQSKTNEKAINNKEIQEEMKLVAFNIYQEIMDDNVDRVIAQAKPIADSAAKKIEAIVKENLSEMDKETLIGTISTGIWAMVSNSLRSQILQQSTESEDTRPN